MLKKLSIKQQMLCLLAWIVILLGVFGAVSWDAVTRLSFDADAMGQGKDIVADILPPPLYIIEAELVASRVRYAKTDEIPALITKLESLKKDYDDRYTYWQKESLDADIKSALFGQQKTEADAFWSVIAGRLIPAARQGNTDQINAAADVARQHYEKHRNGVDQTVKLSVAFADKTLSSLRSSSIGAKLWVTVIAFGGLFVAAMSIILVLLETLRRLGGEPLIMQVTARRIASGDLTESIGVKLGDNSSLLASLSAMQSSLRATISRSRSAADHLADAARGLSSASQQVSAGSAAQSEAAASMAASVEEVTVSIAQVAENAGVARELASTAGSLSSEGSGLVHGAIGQVRKAAESVAATSETIKSLGEKSHQISGIVSVITQIAKQTNLLALNAAIEASRAGESGRSFSVVADEVRLLAERTGVATKEITSMIDDIQREVANAVVGMDAGRDHVNDGVEAALKTGESISRIEQSAQQLLVAVEEISSALNEQNAASAQIAGSVELIAQMAEENSAAVSHVSSAASHLEGLATELKASVDQFTV